MPSAAEMLVLECAVPRCRRALSPLRKTRDAAQLAQRVHAVTAAGQDLVGIGLVAHVPHQAVFRGVEHMVQRHGQLHRSQVGAEVPAGLRNALSTKPRSSVASTLRSAATVCARLPDR